MKKYFTNTHLFLMMLLALSTCGCGSKDRAVSTGETGATAEEPFHVGVLADSTGFMTPHGSANERGATVAAKQLNDRGGILGRKIQLHILDGASDPSITAQRVKELIEKHSISLLLGTTSSATTLAAIPETTSSGVPFIYSLDGECKTGAIGGGGGVSKSVWGAGFTERMAVEPLLSHLHKSTVKSASEFSVYFLGGDYVYPRTTNGYARKVAESLGFQVAGEEYASTSTDDYSTSIRKIMAAKPDLLMVTNPGESGVRFMKQCRTFNVQSNVMISGFATFDQEMIKQMGQASEGVYCINRYSKRLDNADNKQFLKAWETAYPDLPLLPGPTAAAGTYGALVVAARAFERGGAADLNSFREGMRGLVVNLPQGPVSVNPVNNLFDQHLYLLRIEKQQYHVVTDLGVQSHPGFEGGSVR